MKHYHETLNKRSRLIQAPQTDSKTGDRLAPLDSQALKFRIAAALQVQNDYFPCFDWTFPPPITQKSREAVDAAGLYSDRSVVPGNYSAYLHIPFCASLCKFCYYPVIPGRHNDEMERYVGYLLREMALYAPALASERCESIYIGGGTPTFLDNRLLEQLFAGIRRNFRLAPDAEICIESAPGTIPADKVSLLKQLGVNRMSYGIQSLDTGLLASLNRSYSVAGAIEEIECAVAEIGNVNIDTMYGFEGEADDSLLNTLSKFIDIGVPSLSIYALDAQRCDHDRIRFLPGHDERYNRKLEIFREARRFLQERDFVPVLQNIFIRPPHGSYRHQLRRWENISLVALGMSSMGYAPRMLYQNHLALKTYYASIDDGRLPVMETERITREMEMARELVSQLRFTRVDFGKIALKYGVRITDTYADLISALVDLGYLEVDGQTMQLSDKAAPYNNIIPMLFAPDAFKETIFGLPEEYRENFPLPHVLTQVGATQTLPIGIPED
ncbi:MAG: coproporphyrinogen-III oxidase family protein [Acidiferrobacterales bacterium]